MEVSGQLHTPAAFPQGKSPLCPLYRELGGPQSWSGRFGEEKILVLPGLELRPLSRYTNCAIPAPKSCHT
jgi:hypothetical protein